MKRLRLSAALACAAALLAALPALAPASVQVGSSGWQWGNPLPQGNTLRSISFAGANGYAAGDFGTLLRTTDGGTTWSGLLERHLHQPHRGPGHRRRRASSPAGGCVARRSDDGGAHLHARGLHAGRVELQGAVRGRLVRQPRRPASSCSTDGTVLRTDNNGDTFAQKNPLPGTRAPGGGGDAGRRCASSPTRSASARPPTARSTAPPTARTRGASVSDTTRAVRSFFFLDANNGFAVGDGSLFLVTKDGGATWTPQGHRHPADQPALDLVRVADAVRHDHRAGDGARAHRRRRRHGAGSSRPRRTRSSPPASPRRRASPRAARTGATAVSDDAGLNFAPIGGRLSGTLLARARRRPDGHGLRAGRQRLAGQDDRRRQDVDARQRRDLRGRHRRRLPDGARRLRAGLVGRPVPHQRRRRHLEDARHRHDGAPVRSSPRRRRRPCILAGPTGLRRSTDSGDTFSAVKGKDVVEGQARRDRPRRQRALRLGLARPAALDRPRQDVDGAAQADGRTTSRPASSRSTSSTPRTATSWPRAARCGARPTRGKTWTSLPGVGTDKAYGIAFSLEDEGLPGHRSLRRRVAAARASCCKTTDSGATWHPQFVVSTPILGAGIAASTAAPTTCSAASRASCSPRPAATPARRSTLSVDDQAQEAQQAGGHHRHRQALARRGQRAGDRQLPAARARAAGSTRRSRPRPTARTRRAGACGKGTQPLRGPVGGRLPLQGRRLRRADREGRQVGEAHAARAGSATTGPPLAARGTIGIPCLGPMVGIWRVSQPIAGRELEAEALEDRARR